MSGTIPIALTVSAFVVIVCTEVVRAIVHRYRERVHGIGGTQDIMIWGMLIGWLFMIGAMATGAICLSHHFRAKQRSALEARPELSFHLERHWSSACDAGR